MAAEEIHFYLDENVPVVIAHQLRARGIDVITVRDLGLLGDSDVNHLQRATKMGRVLCTYDADFLALAAEGREHAGIVFGQQDTHYIGDWVNYLERIHAAYTAEEMRSRVAYL